MATDVGDEAARHRVASQLRWQAGAPSDLHGVILNEVADDVESAGPAWEALAPHAHLPFQANLALRLMGAAHRLALTGKAPDYAAYLPTCGGSGDPRRAARALLDLCSSELLREQLKQPVQTNEPARSSSLLPAFAHIVEQTGLPLHLREIGASAGLLLRFDAYHHRIGDATWGDPDSPVHFVVDGAAPLGPVPVASRRGCDLHPLDPVRDRILLLSFVWADHVDRFFALDAALRLAAESPVEVAESSAASWLRTELDDPPPDGTTVVYHSIVWQYLTAEEQAQVRRLIMDAGTRATVSSPLAWLRLEPHPRPQEGAELRLTLWPGGDEQLLAICGYHGGRVRWFGDAAGGRDSVTSRT